MRFEQFYDGIAFLFRRSHKHALHIHTVSLVHYFCIVWCFDFFRIWLSRRRYNIHLWFIVINVWHLRFWTILIITNTHHITFTGCIHLTLQLPYCLTNLDKIEKENLELECLFVILRERVETIEFKLTLLVQMIVLSFEVFIAWLVVLVFSFHECYIFGSFFQNLSSARLEKIHNRNEILISCTQYKMKIKVIFIFEVIYCSLYYIFHYTYHFFTL